VNVSRVLVVGGLRRLDAFYRDAPAGLVDGAGQPLLEVDCANEDCPSLEARAATSDAIVLVLGHLSHSVAAKMKGIARRRGIPVVTSTGSSVSRVRASVASAWLELTGRAGNELPRSSSRLAS
jgi:hypothetical protein